MFELLLTSGTLFFNDDDDHELPFPEGTPFKGVVRSRDFINGSLLAQRIGLANGEPINDMSGWLHFVEDNGYNIYIAKKPIRKGVSWLDIDTAQFGKEVVINGKTFIVDFLSGMKFANQPALTGNSGGQWNRYMYNVYGGEFADQLPGSRENWGSYTEQMLGIPSKEDGTLVDGSYTYVKETTSSETGGHITRGVNYPPTEGIPNVMGVWFGGGGNNELNYAWRPMLFEKGGVPPIPQTPFKGEVSQSSFITLTDLQTKTGYSGGALLHPDTPWIKIVDGSGKTMYFPKQPFINNIDRVELNTAGVVDGSMIIDIGGANYKVRLMTGRDGDPSSTVGGEWLEWMTNLTDGTWGFYTDAELGGPYPTPGGMTHIRELHGDGNWGLCGYPGMLGAWYQIVGTGADPAYGWRPVLELVP